MLVFYSCLFATKLLMNRILSSVKLFTNLGGRILNHFCATPFRIAGKFLHQEYHQPPGYTSDAYMPINDHPDQ